MVMSVMVSKFMIFFLFVKIFDLLFFGELKYVWVKWKEVEKIIKLNMGGNNYIML